MNPGNTLAELNDTEHQMLLDAEEKYGDYYRHAVNAVAILNNIAASIDAPEKFLFVAFYSQLKSHLTQALFDAVRCHHVAKGGHLRHGLESMAWAAYAMAHTDLDLFRETTGRGVRVPRRLSDARNAWMDANYHELSERIRNLKDAINGSVAHANVVYAFQTFSAEDVEEGFNTPYFDIEDEFTIQNDLTQVADFAIGAIALLNRVNIDQRVFQTAEGIPELYRALVVEHERLRQIISAHPRHIAAVEGAE